MNSLEEKGLHFRSYSNYWRKREGFILFYLENHFADQDSL